MLTFHASLIQLSLLLLGAMLAAGVLPAVLVLAALFWFRGHAPWELIRTKPLDFIAEWMRGCLAWLSGRAATNFAAPGMRWTTVRDVLTEFLGAS